MAELVIICFDAMERLISPSNFSLQATHWFQSDYIANGNSVTSNAVSLTTERQQDRPLLSGCQYVSPSGYKRYNKLRSARDRRKFVTWELARASK
jgi:hypothetical protein